MKYSEISIAKYLQKLAARSPTPGGGSAAAIFGAIGCALMEMVLNYSNKDKIAVKKGLPVFNKHRIEFLKLIDKDIKAYNRLSLAFGSKNSSKIQSALKDAIMPPLEIANRAYEAAKACRRLLTLTNKKLASDIGCAISSFVAAFEAAMCNVYINLKYIKDKRYAASIKQNIVFLDGKIHVSAKGIIKRVDEIIRR